MDIKQEDFPMYGIMDAANKPGVEHLRASFNKAAAGDEDEQYSFALGMQQMVLLPNVHDIFPAMTPAAQRKTLESCLMVFDDLSAKGAEGPAIMSAYFHAVGFGCKADAVAAKPHFDRAVQINPQHKTMIAQLIGAEKMPFVESGTPFPVKKRFGFF